MMSGEVVVAVDEEDVGSENDSGCPCEKCCTASGGSDVVVGATRGGDGVGDCDDDDAIVLLLERYIVRCICGVR